MTMPKNDEISLVGGESITPHTTAIESDFSFTDSKPFSEFKIHNGYSINTGLDYLTLNVPLDFPEEQKKLQDFEMALKLENLDYDIVTCRNKSSNKVIGERHKYTESTSIFLNDSVSYDRNLTRFELKGDGCRQLEKRYGEDWINGYYKVLYKVIENGGWATRIDLFVDIFNGNITIKELDQKIKKSEFICVPKKFRFDGTMYCKDNSYDGWGALFGCEGAGTRIRIYDKLAEQRARGKSISEDIMSWLRFEVRLNGEVAKTMLLELLDNLGNLQNFALSVLKGVIEFKTPSENKQKERWPTWSKWEKFLKDIAAIKPYNQFKKESSIQVSKKWYGRSATKIHEVDRFTSTKEEFYVSELNNRKVGLEKLVGNYSLLNEINDEREKKGLSRLAMKDIEQELKSVKFELDSYGFIEEVEKDFYSNDIYEDIAQTIK